MHSPICLPWGSGLSFNCIYQILGVWGFCCSPGLLPLDLGKIAFLPPLGLRNLLWGMRAQTIGPERGGLFWDQPLQPWLSRVDPFVFWSVTANKRTQELAMSLWLQISSVRSGSHGHLWAKTLKMLISLCDCHLSVRFISLGSCRRSGISSRILGHLGLPPAYQLCDLGQIPSCLQTSVFP